MQIFVRTLEGKHLVIDTNPNLLVEGLKQKLQEKEHIPTKIQRLLFSGIQLEDHYTLKHYSILKNSTVDLLLRLRGGIIGAKQPSNAVDRIGGDKSLAKNLKYGHIKRYFIRNTCGTGVYEQTQCNFYALAASSAYINTALQIPDLTVPLSFLECYKIASYKGCDIGSTCQSLKLLEDHFKCGITFKRQKDLSIREAITTSSILCFTTNRQGLKDVAKGQFLTKPIKSGNESHLWHAVIVEGYDFDKNCYICKNSWGTEKASARFLFSKSATKYYAFIKVELKEPLKNVLKPRLEKFKGKLYGKTIDCAWMDEKTAVYGTDYICEYHPERKEELKFIGYSIDQWISLTLQHANPGRSILSETSSESDSDDRNHQVRIPELTTLTTDFVIDLLRNKKTLGKGATSTVYKVPNLYTHKGFLALKVINEILKTCKTQIDSQNKKKEWNDEEESDNDLNEENEEENEIYMDKARVIYSEYELLNNLNHPNIIKVFGFYFGDKHHEPAILLEYCRYSLDKAIELLEDVDLVGIAYEICSAMMHIHAHKIIHRDLKPQNILINKCKHVKICDFGIAKVLDATILTSITHNKGTFLYMAPEMFNIDQIYTQKVDVYAFGVVLFFIMTKGKLPTPKSAGGLEDYQLPAEINDLSKKIINKCWSSDPKKRPSFKKLLRCIVDNDFLLINGIESSISNLKEHLGLV